MSIPQTELAPQLMRLFFAAGLVNESDYENYGTVNRRHKPILDVLTQPVSLDSFRDLLNAELTLKSGRAREEESPLHRELSSTTLVHDNEMIQLLALHQRPLASLLGQLTRDNALGEQDAAATLARAAEHKSADYAWLVREGAVTAALISRWLAGLQASAMRQMALHLTLCLLRHNEQLDPSQFTNLSALLQEGERNEVRRRLAEAHGLGSARIRELVEQGLKLPQIHLPEQEADPALFGLFPESLIRRLLIVPLQREGQTLGLATSNPFDLAQMTFLQWATGLWPEPTFATGQAVIQKINEFYGTITSTPLRGEAGENMPPVILPIAPVQPPTPAAAPRRRGKAAAAGNGDAAVATETAVAVIAAAVPAAGPVRTRPLIEGELVADNLSAVQLVSSLIEKAIELRTTDIHIEPAREGVVIRLRIDGELHRIMSVPGVLGQAVVSRIKVLADLDVTERRRPQDGHFELKLDRNNFDFRISTLPALLGEKLVIRILDTAQVKTSLEELGLLPKQRQAMQWMLERAHGMILVTGPTGSGKTSTLYAGLHRLNNENRNLVTIEDPVEYQLPGITQVQVDTHIGLTFSEGLRSILRQDPDVIMVGEIRDSDTARIAIRAATTGHLVLSTLHTNSALGAVDAMVHLGAVPFILASSIVGIISQRLVRKLCLACRKQGKLSAELAGQLGLQPDSKKKIYRAPGCPECLGSGYHGRTAVFEVIRVQEALRTQIATHQRQEVLERTARELGMMGLSQAGLEKVLAGETSPEEVIRKIMLDV